MRKWGSGPRASLRAGSTRVWDFRPPNLRRMDEKEDRGKFSDAWYARFVIHGTSHICTDQKPKGL